jgi:hypothetical protein
VKARGFRIPRHRGESDRYHQRGQDLFIIRGHSQRRPAEIPHG